MAVRIRMKRLGRRHRPFFRVSVMDTRSPRDGRTIEDVGTYDPMVRDKAARVKLNMERIDYWLSVGAKPSENVAALIKKVKTNSFGEVNEPPPMTPPKAPPEPEPEAATEETAAAEESTSVETAAEETAAEETADADESADVEESAPEEDAKES